MCIPKKRILRSIKASLSARARGGGRARQQAAVSPSDNFVRPVKRPCTPRENLRNARDVHPMLWGRRATIGRSISAMYAQDSQEKDWSTEWLIPGWVSPEKTCTDPCQSVVLGTSTE
ncbi:unnamed protein product [Ectocarpus sp. 6 AP-2014]